MKVTEVLLLAVVGWSGVGLAGIVISLARGRRAEALKHSAWIAAVAGLYLLALLTVSVVQARKLVQIGQAQCFDEMCFTVMGVDELPDSVSAEPGRVVRVTVRVANGGRSTEAERLIEAYLVDSRGREWRPLPGLSGNRLNASVAGRSTIVSQPIFRVAADAAGLGLVFTHGSWQTGRFVIGDSDSLGHRRTVVLLER